MSALDDKLNEIFKKQYEPILNNADEWLPLVKQAIADEVLPLVNQMAGLVNNVLNQPTMEYLEKPDYHFDEEPQKLDDKLREAVIYSGKHVGAWDDQLTEAVLNGEKRTVFIYVPSLIEATKQAFADEGYAKERLYKGADGEWHTDLMTGQQFYDKYMKELTENYDLHSPQFTAVQAIEAAMKAAGLTDE
jgi:hypothetical protein